MQDNQQPKGWLEKRLEDPQFRRLYERECVAEEFICALEEQMRKESVTRTALAEKMGCSPANITRVMSSTTNLTLKSIIEMAFAVDMRVRLNLEPMLSHSRAVTPMVVQRWTPPKMSVNSLEGASGGAPAPTPRTWMVVEAGTSPEESCIS